MNTKLKAILAATALAAVASPALAQFSIDWSTIDGGGGNLTGGTFVLDSTIAQFDAAAPITGGAFTISGGFWTYSTAPACIADMDDGTGTGTPDGGVTIDDLLFYLGIFNQGVTRADVDDGSGTGSPDGGVTIDDLLYFLLRFGDGC